MIGRQFHLRNILLIYRIQISSPGLTLRRKDRYFTWFKPILLFSSQTKSSKCHNYL